LGHPVTPHRVSPWSRAPTPSGPSFRLAEDAGPEDPLPRELDTAERWRARVRLVRPDADLDATSAHPRASRIPGVYDDPTSRIGSGKAGE